MKVFGLDLSAITDADLTDVDKYPSKLAGAKVRLNTASIITNWAMGGWVPSVITAADSSVNPFIEVWLSKNSIGYSNLLTGVTNLDDALLWTNCSFYVTAKPASFSHALANNDRLKIYILKDRLNEEWCDAQEWVRESNKLLENQERIIVVKSLADVEELERA